jgi:tetratricopeptide (TPR) repeat protein
MTDDLRRRFAEIEATLAAPEPEARAAVRESIVTLFRDTEREIAELTEFRETIRGLIDRYKTTFAQAPDAPARSARVDHLGSSTHAERAWSAIAGGRYEVAEKEAARALELAPGDARATVLLGWSRAAAGAPDEALRILDAHLTASPHDALGAAAMGLALLQAGRPTDAVARLEPLLAATGDRKALLYGHHFLGLARIALGEYPEAREAVGRALEFGPGVVEAYWQTGRSHYIEGDFNGAASAWRRGAEANRFDPWAERCEEAVRCLEEGRPVSLD